MRLEWHWLGPLVTVPFVPAMLLVAGIIEGFVTGSALPTPIRIGLGLGLAFWLYAWALGRRAAAEGRTGAIDEADAAWYRPRPAAGSGLG